MTLNQMIANPHQQFRHVARSPWFDGKFTIETLENLSPAEQSNLLSHLFLTPASWQAFSEEQGDRVLASLLSQTDSQSGFIHSLLTTGVEIGGRKTVAWMISKIDAGELHLVNGFPLQILWRVMGPASIPLIARCKATAARHLDSSFESIREQAGASKTAWDLLVAPREKSARELESLMRRGVSLPAGEWKLIAEYSAAADALQGLVLSAGAGRFFLIPDWPAEEDCAVSIAHPSMFSAEQSQYWKAQVSGRKPPFSQFEASTALRLDPVGLVANPADLFLALEGAGWVRGRAGREDGRIRTHTKTFPDIDVVAEIEYEEGVPTRFGGRWATQTIRSYRFFRQSRGLEIPLEFVHPIALSSVMADLAPLGAPLGAPR